MAEELSMQSGIERRTQRRYDCYWPANCRRGEELVDRVIVIDASTGGFRIASSIEVRVGQIVVLELDEIGTFTCEVRWTASDRFGVVIQNAGHELTASDVDYLAERLDWPTPIRDASF